MHLSVPMSHPNEPESPLGWRGELSEPPVGRNGKSALEHAALEARLSSAEQTLRDISHALAHDLRTSLRHVASYAQLLGDAAQHPEAAQRLSHKVVDASRHLQRLMESVSALARLQAAELTPRRVDTPVLLRSLIRELDERSQGPRVACVLAPDLPLVQADPSLLRRVWQELLDNAWRHASRHAQPRINIDAKPLDDAVAFFVHDNGPGFEPERAAELFGLFHRADAVPGLGVGLAMVRRIVECHGGQVWASARPGEGASFGFSLPTKAR
jgi:signal transduction histidine kinase